MKLIKKEVLAQFYERYDLEIENTHNFIAEGIVVHNTSAHLSFKWENEWKVNFFAGGESHTRFVALFNQEDLIKRFTDLGWPIDKTHTIYGECYGASQQGMSHTYGKDLRFIVFDVRIGDCWLDVPNAEDVAKKLGLEFVYYEKCSTDLASLDAQRDFPSIQAIRNGVSSLFQPDKPITVDNISNPKPREGVVLRPMVEMTDNRGNRVICKHKGDAFKETATPRPVVDPSKMKVMADANAVAEEWITTNRLEHILQKIPNHGMEKMREIIAAAQEDVKREGSGEIVWSDAVAKAIGKKTVDMYKAYLKSKITA